MTNDNVAPSITSSISLMLLEMETPSTVNEAFCAVAVSVFVLKKLSFELPLPTPYSILFPLLSFKVNDVVDGTDAILYDVREESPFKAVPPAKYWTVSPTFKPCADV